MCEFHDCNGNGLGDIWWTDKCMYFSSIDCSTKAAGLMKKEMEFRKKTIDTQLLTIW